MPRWTWRQGQRDGHRAASLRNVVGVPLDTLVFRVVAERARRAFDLRRSTLTGSRSNVGARRQRAGAPAGASARAGGSTDIEIASVPRGPQRAGPPDRHGARDGARLLVPDPGRPSRRLGPAPVRGRRRRDLQRGRGLRRRDHHDHAGSGRRDGSARRAGWPARPLQGAASVRDFAVAISAELRGAQEPTAACTVEVAAFGEERAAYLPRAARAEVLALGRREARPVPVSRRW